MLSWFRKYTAPFNKIVAVLRRINPVYFFVVAAVFFQLTLNYVRPPLQSPDEFFHFCRAYQISEGNFLPVVKDQRVGGELPVCIKDFLSFYMPSTFIGNFKTGTGVVLEPYLIACSDSTRVFIDFPNTSTYSPLAYFPHSLGLFILRQFHCPIGVQYVGSKLLAFIIYLLCMVFVIRSIPVYKWLIAMLALLPMNLYMVNSFTGDTMTNALVFMLIALTLKHRFSQTPLSGRDLAALLLIGILLAFTKVIYASLLFLLLMVPAARFRSPFRKYVTLAVLISVSFLLANAWSSKVMEYYPTYENYNKDYRMSITIHKTADHHKQLGHLAAHKTHIFKVVFSALTTEPEFYLRSYVGHFGTYMDTPVPDWFFMMAYIVIVLVAFFEKNLYHLSVPDKLIMLGSGLLAFSLIIFSQHLVWNDIGADTFPTFQGRYLAPLMPLLFMLFSHRWQRITFSPSWLVLAFVIYSNAYCCDLLFKRFIKEDHKSRVDFRCDSETRADSTSLKTTDPKIRLSGVKQRSAKEHRSGRYSIALRPFSDSIAEYKFENLHLGDLVEIYAWQKGQGGEIVVQGEGNNCAPYHFTNKDIQLSEKSGWKKMQMIFSMFMDCDSSRVSFHLRNTTKDTVYFDDLRYSVKRYR